MKDSDVIKIMRKEVNMSQSEFAEYFNIPKRTLQDWEYGKRNIAHYLLELMIYKLKHEKQIQCEDVPKKDGELC